MKVQAFWVAASLLASVIVTAQDKPSPEAEALFTKMMSQINKRHVQWVHTTADEVNDKRLDSGAVMIKAKNYGVLGNMSNADIEALAFLILMQAAKSAQEDLKAIMAQVKAINEKKQQLRSAKSALDNKNKTVSRVQMDSIKRLVNLGKTASTARQIKTASNQAVTSREINEVTAKVNSELDAVGELGEEQSLKMQITMDRMSKQMSTISNLLKKISSTAQTITQNLK